MGFPKAFSKWLMALHPNSSQNETSAYCKIDLALSGNCQGFSFIELLIVVSIASIVAFSIITMNLQLKKSQRENANLVNIDLLKRNFLAIVLDEASWKNTIAAGAATGPKPLGKTDCLLNATSCTVDGSATGAPIQDQNFAIYDASNTLIYDATNPSAGFTLNGTPCTTFSSSGNNDCPLRFDLKWSAVCTGSCINPLVKVNAVLLYPSSGGSQMIIKTSTYSLPDTMRAAQ